MNIILNENFTAIYKGNVSPIEREGQFAVDGKIEYPLATLKEIAIANKFKIPSSIKTKAKMNEFVFEELNKLNIAESKMSKLEKVIEIVNAGVEAGKTDEDMLIEIVQSGVKFKEANKLFTQAMEQAGHRISPKERTSQIFAILDDAEFAPEAYADVQAMVATIVKEVADTSDKQALAGIRKWAKENEVELPKAPKNATGRASGGDMNTLICNFMVGKAEYSAEEVTEFIRSKKPEVSDGSIASYLKHSKRSFDFAQKCIEASK